MKKLTVISIFILIITFTSFTTLARSRKPVLLTLKDAVFLALRYNPTIKSANLDRVTQKYALFVAKKEFRPKYSLGASWQHTETTSNGEDSRSTDNNAEASISLKTAYGTQLELSSTNPISEPPGYWHPALSLKITQPLIKGFGRAVVEQALNEALDNEVINKLNLKSTIISTVNQVINDYISLFQAKEQIEIDNSSLKKYHRTLTQTEALIKAGRRAKIDLLETQSQYEELMVQMQNDKNSYQQKLAAFLDTLGLPSDAKIEIPKNLDFDKIARILTGGKTLLSLKQSKQLALENNIDYQIEKLTLKSLNRTLIIAKNSAKWELNLNAEGTVGGASGSGGNSGINSLFNGQNRSETIGLTLKIPIDDVEAKQALLNAKIGLDKGNINYNEKKRDLDLQVESTRNSVISSQKQLKLAEKALKTRQRTLKMTEIKHQAGLIPTSQLLDQQEDLIQSEQSVLSAKIGYIQAFIEFNKLIATILDHWGIKIRY